MPNFLKNLRVTRVDLVDNGANQDHTGDGAHVLLFKRAPNSTEDEMPNLSEMTADELRKHAEDQQEAFDALQKSFDEQAEQVQSLTEKVDELTAELAVDTTEPTEEDVLKGLPDSVKELLAKRDAETEELRKRADAAEEIAKGEREARLTKEYIAKAEALPTLEGDTAQIAGDLREMHEALDEEVAKRLHGHFERLDGLVAQSALFEKMARRDDGQEKTAAHEIEELAKQAVVDGRASTMEQARADVFASRMDLAKKYREEQ